MYAGTTLRRGSGKFVGVHQKINRAARKALNRQFSKTDNFPNIKDILHFEGNNGPDAVKYKMPASDEPWHFINPEDPNDRKLINMINDHIVNLSRALRDNDNVRASFEAAWLAHSIVDGLTPAHHYPFNEKIEELWGKPYHERSSMRDRNIIHGYSTKDTISKNWQYYGAKGVLTAHFMFEMGIASSMASRNPIEFHLVQKDLDELTTNGFEKVFITSMHRIFQMKMYDEFRETGWNRKLLIKTKKKLLPEIVRAVALAWYQAVLMTSEITDGR